VIDRFAAFLGRPWVLLASVVLAVALSVVPFLVSGPQWLGAIALPFAGTTGIGMAERDWDPGRYATRKDTDRG
jgi:hypothetical protein